MTNELIGRRIAFLVANSGVEQGELTTSWKATKDAGGEPTLIAPDLTAIQAMHGDAERGDTFVPDAAVADVSATGFDALVLPGGVANSDQLRLVPSAVSLVRAFATTGRPIAAIGHAPWLLVEADLVRGKALTSRASLATDIRNAGGEWRDEPVVVCDRQGFSLITSRRLDDLTAFTKAVLATVGRPRSSTTHPGMNGALGG